MPELELELKLFARAVPVRFGTDLSWLAREIARVCGERRPQLLLVSDERVALLHADVLAHELSSAGFAVHRAILPQGERHKRMPRVQELLDSLVERHFARDDLIIGFGGGVVTDCAGFAAAVYRRGTDWIAAPTTLMGMADAAIGGKTGVDHALGKNLIGAFHQPLAVLAATDTLATLDAREWASGSAEVVKTALIGNGNLWRHVMTWGVNLRDWPQQEILPAIAEAARVKIRFVEQDERESGVRRILNFGHTFGHALESATRYELFAHGEAIFLGMRAATRLSRASGLLSAEDAAQIESVLATAKFPRATIGVSALLAALEHDKKYVARAQHWVLLRAVADPVVSAGVATKLVEQTADWLCQTVATGESSAARRPFRVLVIHGPNLNLLGAREPHIYGHASYDELVQHVDAAARQRGLETLFRHSNHEGEIVELVQRARHWADGIIINPGGYAHTSVAIRDALAAARIPAVEVHLTNLATRENFRQQMLTATACIATVAGKGRDGYGEALDILASTFEKQTESFPTCKTHP